MFEIVILNRLLRFLEAKVNRGVHNPEAFRKSEYISVNSCVVRNVISHDI